jgi:hypothetical protein
MVSLNILRIHVPAEADSLQLARQRLVKFVIAHAEKDTGRQVNLPAVFHSLTTQLADQNPAWS